MGLLDGLLNAASGLAGGNQQDGLMKAAMQLVRDNPGGLAGVVEQLRGAGLGDAVNSWVGSGANQPVSADSLKEALGDGQLAALAGRFGISGEQLSSGLATVLPQLVDRLTPNGAVDGSSNELLDAGLDLLKNKLFGG